jgi:response regulator RpfG family c-di-GMP phosphodiesterase
LVADRRTREIAEVPWKPRIIVITPYPEDLLFLSAQLLGADYDVAESMSMSEAEKELSRSIPHLVIIDPTLDGFDSESLNHLLKRFSGHAQVPMLYLIDRDQQDAVHGIIREGIDDTLLKPVSSLELITRTRSLLRNRQLLGQIRLQEIFLRRRGMRPFSPESKIPDILLFEDEGKFRNQIADIIQNMNCSITKADGAREALELVSHAPQDLIIMDILFPEKDCFDLCRYLKGNPATRNIPLLMLTSVPELDNRILGFDFGPDDYLVKPAPDLEIQTRIRRLLTRKYGHDRIEANHQILIRENLADPFSGYAGKEYFQFYLPEMIQWAQAASLPFTLSTFKFRTVEELQKAAQILTYSLRNLDAVFRTGDLELALALPETPSSRARHAHTRIGKLLEKEGLERGYYMLGSASTPEDGWSPKELLSLTGYRATVETIGHRLEKEKEIGKVFVLSQNGSGISLARNLVSVGLSNTESVSVEDLKKKQPAPSDLLILEGDLDTAKNTVSSVRALPHGRKFPVLLRLAGIATEDEDRILSEIVDDYVPGDTGIPYLAHRARQLTRVSEATSTRTHVEGILGHLVKMAESSDPTMRGHTQRVSQLALSLGVRLNLTSHELEILRWGALLHDIGKIFVPYHILNKQGMLNPEEYAVVKSHPKVGYNLCCEIPFLEGALPLIKHHHERIDGGGYPEGLTGDQIPHLVRLLTVVDVHDSLLAARTYREGFDSEEASRILMSESDKGMWDGYLVGEFMEMIQAV